MSPIRLALVALVALGALVTPARTQSIQPPPLPSSGPTTLPETIPLFPLPDVAIFPNVAKPFNIYEERYRTMLTDAIAGDQVIGLVMLRPGFESDYEGRPPVYAIGCAATIVDYQLQSNGQYYLVLRGLMKFRILSEDQSRPYRVARVEPLPEVVEPGDRPALTAQRDRIVKLLLDVIPTALAPPIEVTDEDVINILAQRLPMATADRQVLLEKDGLLARSETLIDLLELMR
ncbi:MAG: LON peptidase substrate-binding domain-containing protein [Vicinamibacterales bacterium]